MTVKLSTAFLTWRYRRSAASELSRVDDAVLDAQVAAVREVRAARDGDAVAAALDRVVGAACGGDNLLPPMREALSRMATVGEVCDALRGVFGRYHPS